MTETKKTENNSLDNWKNQATFLLEKAKTILITNQDEYTKAGEAFADIKRQRKELEAERKSWVAPLNDQVKRLNAQFNAIDESLSAASLPYSAAMIAYKEQEERDHRAAEEAAEKERKRLEDEAKQKAEAEIERLEAAKRAQKEAEKIAETAEDPVAAYLAMQQAGEAEKAAEAARSEAEAAIRESVMAPRAVVVSAAPKAKAAGTSYRTTWKARVVDASLIPREYLIPDEKMLAAMAKAAKGPSKIPGVEFYSEKTIGGR